MTKCKRTLSLLLAAALLMTTLMIGNISASAMDIGITRLEAETYGRANLFAKQNSTDYSGDSAYTVGAGLVENTQSAAEIDAVLEPTQTPYVEFLLNAAETKKYELKVRFRHTDYVSESDAAYEGNPAVYLLLNDQPAQTLEITTAKNGDAAEHEALSFSVDLKAGRNVLRFTGFTKEVIDAFATLGGVTDPTLALDYLDVPEGVQGITNSSSTNYTLGNASTSNTVDAGLIYNKMTINGWDYTVQSYSGSTTVDTLSVETLKDVPFLSTTVDAPADGYYLVSLQLGSRDAAAAATRMGVLVNGENPDRKMGVRAGNNQYNDFIVYLREGANAITFTGLLDTAETGFTLRNLRVYGGLALSGEQINPMTGATRLETEKYAALKNLFKDTTGATRYSNGAAVATQWDMSSYGKNIQSLEAMGEYLDYTVTPFLQFYLDAEDDGVYDINIRYHTLDYKFAEPHNLKAVWIANDGKPTEFEITTASGGDAESINNTVTLSIPLKKGRNILRLTSLSKNCIDDITANATANKTNFTFRIDYLDVPEGVSGVLPATNDGSQLLYGSSGNVKAKYGNMTQGGYEYEAKASDYENVSVTFDNLNLANLKDVPYYSLTLNAPSDGYYLIRQRSGPNEDSDDKSVMAVLVNGEVPEHKPTVARNSLWSEYIVSLKAGTNIIVFTGLYDNGKQTLRASHLRLYGGLAVADEQLSPFVTDITVSTVVDGIELELPEGNVAPGEEMNIKVTGIKENLTPVLGIEYGTGESYGWERVLLTDNSFTFTLPDIDILPVDGNIRLSVVYLGDANNDAQINILDLIRMKKVSLDSQGYDFSTELSADIDYEDDQEGNPLLSIDANDLCTLRRWLLEN